MTTTPVPGLIFRYDFLWSHEYSRGQITSKDRPACVVIVIEPKPPGQRSRVLLVPITHSEPGPGTLALELPQTEKVRLGLDSDRSWLILNEMNRDWWPNGTTPVSETGSVAYGRLSKPVLRRVLVTLAEGLRRGLIRTIDRD